ncbi:MAG: hypothetical protein RL033_6672 [Pseudomonadota bacterium]|jgi:hypothetical protein
MVGRKGARKALARALSQVVLSQETILVHAGSVLDRAELIEGSLHSAAFNLWFAVLQRAEAEGAVERLVGSVLEENPRAELLREALRDWQQAVSQPVVLTPELAHPTVMPALDDTLPEDERRTGHRSPRKRSLGELARWVVLAALALGLAWRLVYREPERVGVALLPRVPPPAVVSPVPDAGRGLEPRGPTSSGSGAGVQKKGR